jgi:hypothetical protein
VDEYDRWYRNYRRRQAFWTHIGYVLAGFALACILYAFILLASAVLG